MNIRIYQIICMNISVVSQSTSELFSIVSGMEWNVQSEGKGQVELGPGSGAP